MRMNYIELMEQLKNDENSFRFIIFHPKNSKETFKLKYLKGIDSFALLDANDEGFIRNRPIGLHQSLFNGTFEWKENDEN